MFQGVPGSSEAQNMHWEASSDWKFLSRALTGLGSSSGRATLYYNTRRVNDLYRIVAPSRILQIRFLSALSLSRILQFPFLEFYRHVDITLLST